MKRIHIVGLFIYISTQLSSGVFAQGTVPLGTNLTSLCTEEQTKAAGYLLDYLKTPDDWLYRSGMFEQFEVMNPAELQIAIKFNELLKYHGSNLIMLPIPTKSLVSFKEANFDAKALQTSYYTGLNLLEKNNIVAVDLLTPALDNYVHEATGRTFNDKYDSHWGAYGVELSVKELVKKIQSIASFAELPHHSYSAISVAARGLGNLSTEAIRRCGAKFPFVDVTLLKVSRKKLDNESLLDDEIPFIALLGTSYSKTPDFNLIGRLQLVLQADVLDYSFIGGGKVSSLKSFLKDFVGKDALPKLIIWEFPVYQTMDAGEAENITKLLNSW